MKPGVSVPLTFGELAIREHFIGFPLDGDDSGHGGFRGAHNVFVKLSHDEAMNITSHTLSHCPEKMQVLKLNL